MSEPKIVCFDLETLPHAKEIIKNYVSLSDWPGKTIRASLMTIGCVGWKLFGEKKTHCLGAWDFPAWEKDINDDYALVKAFYDIVADADAVVTHNGRRFDWKFLDSRLMFHGLPPLPGIKHIDTCQIARSKLFLHSNRLGDLSTFLGGEKKMENGGWDLWVRVIAREPSAIRTMVKYCKHDVDLVEHAYRKLKSLSSGINQNLFGVGLRIICPTCGSTRIQRRGHHLTKVARYPRFQCKDCGSWGRSDKDGKAVR
jgi:DNA polymerase elongation subunit (family B)